MPTPGYVFRDGGTTPPAQDEAKNEEKRLTSSSPGADSSHSSSAQDRSKFTSPVEQDASHSHALAVSDHSLKGAAQNAGETEELTDVGWRSPSSEIDTLVGGLANEDLWALIRRFNKVR